MEAIKEVTGKQVKDMLLGAYHGFEKNFEAINELNVFPVPDGDTGTNMMHTMASVAKAISAMSDDAEAGEIGAAAAVVLLWVLEAIPVLFYPSFYVASAKV